MSQEGKTQRTSVSGHYNKMSIQWLYPLIQQRQLNPLQKTCLLDKLYTESFATCNRGLSLFHQNNMQHIQQNRPILNTVHYNWLKMIKELLYILCKKLKMLQAQQVLYFFFLLEKDFHSYSQIHNSKRDDNMTKIESLKTVLSEGFWVIELV